MKTKQSEETVTIDAAFVSRQAKDAVHQFFKPITSALDTTTHKKGFTRDAAGGRQGHSAPSNKRRG